MVKLGITFILKRDNNGKITVNSINPTRKVIVNNITFKNKQFQIDLNSIGGRFDGIYHLSSQKLKRKWYQGGQGV